MLAILVCSFLFCSSLFFKKCNTVKMTSLMDKIELLIKKEKASPERKKNEPAKSSNEILSELFGAFNAAPPKIEDLTPKKSKKGKKKHKKEKKKRSRSSSSNDSDNSDYSPKHKKRKKSKSKKRSHSPTYSPKHRSRSPKIKIDPSLLINLKPDIKTEKSENIKVKQEKPKSEPQNMQKRVPIKIEDTPDIDASLIPMPESPKDLDTSDLRLKLDGKKSDPDEKNKGKIQIKNLKFSTVFEETVKQAEEQARRKAEKYEEGEYTDSSSESLKEVVINTQFPKSADPGGILKKAAEDIKVPQEEKPHKKSSKIDKERESSHKSSRKEREKDRTETKRSSSKSRRSRSRSASRRHSHTSSLRSKHRSSSRTRRRSRSRQRIYPHRHHSPPRYRGGGRRSSRSPSGVKLADSEKKRLLEVARRNAINMLKNGEVPGGTAALPPHTRNQVMAAIQSGGKSVDELTDFCKHLSKKEALGELSSVCSEDEDMSENEDTMAFHHPFLVKEKAPIIMNIRGGAPLPVKSTALVANKDELRMQFPVSSGSQHRDKASEWVPVEPKKDLPVAKLNSKSNPQPVPPPKAIEPAPVTAAPIASGIPVPASVPLAAPVPMASSLHSGASAITAAANQIAAACQIDVASHPVGIPSMPQPVPLALHAPPPPAVEPPPYMKGFASGSHLSTVSSLPVLPAPGPQAYPPGIIPPKIDIASIVSQKLLMIRKEQEKNEGPSKGFGWSKDRHLGQFTGSTGAQILTPRELAAGTQAWAKKDQLTRAAPVAGGMGMHLLQKMGWTPGRGLGKEGTGALQPLLLEVKLDTKGLQAKEEIPQRFNRGGNKGMRGRGVARGAGSAPLSSTAATPGGGKHPVSILGEYCSKHKIGPPEYNLCFECGPDHKKNFLFKVRVNGIEYQPAVASQNKKQAKADAALLALQKLGLPT